MSYGPASLRCVYAWTAMLSLAGCSPIGLVGGAFQLGSGPSAAATIPRPTLGGSQFWSDQHFFHEWRIQRRADSDNYRLLDSREWQHAAGTFEDCLARLEEIKREQNLEPMKGNAAVLVHGLAAPRWSMRLLGRHLHKHAGYKIFNVEYASTRCTIDEHAQSLASVIQSLEGIEQINLVGHSLGNVVIRRYLAGQAGAIDTWRPDPRIRRIVMIAPPNHGSLAATKLSDKGLFKTVFGTSGQQLGVEWEALESRLATPRVEFGIIAGGRGNGRGFSFLLPGDDDGRITVDTTRLAGAADFVMVPMLHELIANDPRVFDHTLRFFQQGCFISPELREPIGQESVVGREPAQLMR